MTSYLRVHWFHDFENEPIELLYELDDQRNVIRQIEEFRDGLVKIRSEHINSESLADTPLPGIEAINRSSEFQAAELTALEFDTAWQQAYPPSRE